MRKANCLPRAILFMAALVVSLSVGCGGGTAPEARNSLIIAHNAQPVSLDPSNANDGGSNLINSHIFDTLVFMPFIDGEFSITPGLAESWEFLSPDSIRFNLRRGVRFHNGDLLRASDVQFSIERAIASPRVGFIVNAIREVVIINDYEVIMNLHFPFAPILSNLAHVGASIVSERAVRESGDAFGLSRPIGTGPFKFSNWVHGVSVSLERFEDYWGPKPAFEQMEIRVIPDGSMRLIEVETGNVDVALIILPPDVPLAERDPRVNMLREFSMEKTYIAFNHDREPFNNLYVRRAIIHAIDREAIRANIWQNTGQVSHGPINDVVWGSINSQLPPYEFNIELAREYMARAGLQDGFDAVFTINAANQSLLDMGEFIQAQLRQININLSVVAIEPGVLFDTLARGEFDMFTLSWTTVTGDADYGLFPLFHTSSIGTAGNRFRYRNPQVDALLDRGRSEVDPAIRLPIYAEVQRIIRDDAPWVFVLQNEHLVASTASVQGLSLSPLGTSQHTFRNITFR